MERGFYKTLKVEEEGRQGLGRQVSPAFPGKEGREKN
jgi:hypothetical protein